MSTLIEELEQAADDYFSQCDEPTGNGECLACQRGARLRARLEHVRKMLENPYDANPLAEAVMWSTSNYETYRRDNMRETMKRIGHALTGPIPPSDETGGER